VARRRSVPRQLERELVRAARRADPKRGRIRRAADDTQLVADRFVVRPDWAKVEDGRAARLSPTETIEVTRTGRFADKDPLEVVVGWRSVGRALGLGVLAAGVGLSYWRGQRWGTGPLGVVKDRDGLW
jgi:hypothetical protein